MNRNELLAAMVGQNLLYKNVPPVRNYCAEWRNGQSNKVNAALIRLSSAGQTRSTVNPFRSIR